MDGDCPDENALKVERSGITEVILVRHGETTWNSDGILQVMVKKDGCLFHWAYFSVVLWTNSLSHGRIYPQLCNCSFSKAWVPPCFFLDGGYWLRLFALMFTIVVSPIEVVSVSLVQIVEVGQLETELNELGWRQAEAVAERLAKESSISALYSSDLKRALDTATIISQKCGLQVIPNSALRERHLGKLQGLSRREAPLLDPVAFQAFTSHKKRNNPIPGGGESCDQFYDRSTSALEEIANKHRGERVLVVTHGGVFRMLWEFVGGKSSPGKILNTAVSVIRKDENGSWFVHSWGDTSHLNGVGVLKSGFGGDSESG